MKQTIAMNHVSIITKFSQLKANSLIQSLSMIMIKLNFSTTSRLFKLPSFSLHFTRNLLPAEESSSWKNKLANNRKNQLTDFIFIKTCRAEKSTHIQKKKKKKKLFHYNNFCVSMAMSDNDDWSAWDVFAFETKKII